MGGKLSTKSAAIKLSTEKNVIGILAFEVASAMSKIMQLWQSLNDEEMGRLRSEVTKDEGVVKLVSDSEAVLLSLACTEKLKELSSLAALVARLGQRCENAALQGFTNDIWNQIDAYTPREMDAKIKKMGRYVGATANLYLLEGLESAGKERARKESEASEESEASAESEASEESEASAGEECEASAEIARQRQHWRRISLWNRTYDQVVKLLARTVCTIHGRIVFVFGSQMVHSAASYPAASTLGGAALALHYSNAILLIENMVSFPTLVASDSRHDLYNMLPHNMRIVLRARLKGLAIDKSSLDPAQCQATLDRILGWLAPLAHNTILWHSEHVFDLQVANILLLQTLYFADQLKAEAAIVDLLVGLTCVLLHETEKQVNVYPES